MQIFRTPFPGNTSGGLLLRIRKKSCLVFYKRATLQNFVVFTEERLQWSLVFTKVTDLDLEIQNRTLWYGFLVYFAKSFNACVWIRIEVMKHAL